MGSSLVILGVVVVAVLWAILGRRQRRAEIVRMRPQDEDLRPRTPPPPLPAEAEARLQKFLARRRAIDAIKLVRAHTGWGLKQAKQYVQWRLDPRRPIPELPSSLLAAAPQDLEHELRRLVERGRTIEAVRYVVSQTGWDLEQALRYVEELERS
ncbi:hypothetical protein JXA88_03835 [Candidatus Fermentibacteria bacterium]|nr:hypothetical protein [Candidatus Fermentibacteria bacterium]